MTPDPTASLDAEQARQRVLDLSTAHNSKASYYRDVQDVCRIALDAMAERDALRVSLDAIKEDRDGVLVRRDELSHECRDLRAKLAAATNEERGHITKGEVWFARARSTAHWIDVVIRYDGKTDRIQADWLKAWSVTPAAAQQPAADEAAIEAALAEIDAAGYARALGESSDRRGVQALQAARELFRRPATPPRQDDALLRELRATLVAWARTASMSVIAGTFTRASILRDVIAKIDELLAAKPAPAADGDPTSREPAMTLPIHPVTASVSAASVPAVAVARDRRLQLQIKLKTLMCEARIIRSEEQHQLYLVRASKASATHPGESAPWHFSQFKSLHYHRTGPVRSEARYSYLAYAFLRGKVFRKTENKSDVGRIDQPRLHAIITRFAGGPTSLTTVSEWLHGITQP